MPKTLQHLLFAAPQLLEELRPLLNTVVTALFKQAKTPFLKLFFRDFDHSDRLAGHHLLDKRCEQIEPFEQGSTLSTDRPPQLRNHSSAIHKPNATAED